MCHLCLKKLHVISRPWDWLAGSFILAGWSLFLAGWSHEVGGTRWEVLGVEFIKARMPNVHPGSHPLLSARLAAIVFSGWLEFLPGWLKLSWLSGASFWLAGSVMCDVCGRRWRVCGAEKLGLTMCILSPPSALYLTRWKCFLVGSSSYWLAAVSPSAGWSLWSCEVSGVRWEVPDVSMNL